MDTSFVYVIISLIIMEFESCHGNPVRRTRIAMDTDDDELSRKIVPKSIFIAPLFTCPPGYAQNDDGDCLRIIRVSHNAQMDFILSRLRSIVDSNGEIIICSKKDNRQHSIKARPVQPSTPPPQNSIRPIGKHRTDTNEPVKIQIPIV